MNYTDPATSARIDSLIESLENSTYINQHLSKSWLHDFRTVTRAQVNQNMHKYICDQQVVLRLMDPYINVFIGTIQNYRSAQWAIRTLINMLS